MLYTGNNIIFTQSLGGKGKMNTPKNVVDVLETEFLERELSKAQAEADLANERLEDIKSAVKKAKIKKTIVMNPDNVIFDEESGTTVAFWPDGTKTIVKVEAPDNFNPFCGWAWAMLVKAKAKELNCSDREAKSALMASYACAERQNARTNKEKTIYEKKKAAKKVSTEMAAKYKDE